MLTDEAAASPDASSATWQAWTGSAWAAQPALTCTVATAAELSAAQAALASAARAASLQALRSAAGSCLSGCCVCTEHGYVRLGGPQPPGGTCLSCISGCGTPEQVKHFRGPCADCCKPLAPCCCVSADGEAIFGCVLTDRKYFLPACLHMALCPQLGCDPKGGDKSLDCNSVCYIFLCPIYYWQRTDLDNVQWEQHHELCFPGYW